MYRRTKTKVMNGNNIRINLNGTNNKTDLKWAKKLNVAMEYSYLGIEGNYIICKDQKKPMNGPFKISKNTVEEKYRNFIKALKTPRFVLSHECGFKDYYINDEFEVITNSRNKKDGTVRKSDIKYKKMIDEFCEKVGFPKILEYKGRLVNGDKLVVEFLQSELYLSLSKQSLKEKHLVAMGINKKNSPAESCLISLLNSQRIYNIREITIEWLLSPGIKRILDNLSIERRKSLHNLTGARVDFLVLVPPFYDSAHVISLKGSKHHEKYDSAFEENKDILNALNVGYTLIEHEDGVNNDSSKKETFVNEILQTLKINNLFGDTDKVIKDMNTYNENIEGIVYKRDFIYKKINEGYLHKEAEKFFLEHAEYLKQATI